jgi:thiazole synthase ThiGH ThiG subunit
MEDYDSLNSSYFGLESNYDAVLGQSAFSRNLNYVLIASTIALAVTSVYFAKKARPPKSASRTRY